MDSQLLDPVAGDRPPPSGKIATLAKDCCSRGAIYVSILTTVSILIYSDRGIFGAIGPVVLGSCTAKLGVCDTKLKLTSDEFGVLAGLFVGGFAVASLLTAQLARYIRHNLLISGGLLVWMTAAVAAAFAPSFALMAIARTLSGVGEATLVTLAPAIIEDVAPKSMRNAWLAIFFSAIPLGFAVGYFTGGALGTTTNGRMKVFLLEAIAMVPFALLSLVVPDSASLRAGTGGGGHGASAFDVVDDAEAAGAGKNDAWDAGGLGAECVDGNESDAEWRHSEATSVASAGLVVHDADGSAIGSDGKDGGIRSSSPCECIYVKFTLTICTNPAHHLTRPPYYR